MSTNPKHTRDVGGVGEHTPMTHAGRRAVVDHFVDRILGATEGQIEAIPACIGTMREIGCCLPDLATAMMQAHEGVQDAARQAIVELLTVLRDQRAALAEAMVYALLLRWHRRDRDGTYDLTCRRLSRAFEHIVTLEQLEEA